MAEINITATQAPDSQGTTAWKHDRDGRRHGGDETPPRPKAWEYAHTHVLLMEQRERKEARERKKEREQRESAKDSLEHRWAILSTGIR